MEKQTNKQALETLEENLYKSNLKNLGKNLNNLLRAKKTQAINRANSQNEELEK